MTEEKIKNNSECKDKFCPIHGSFSARGRSFQGKVIRRFPKRAVIEFERTVFIKKYERYAKRKTKLHARLPECMNNIELGDFIEIRECRPISKIIHFVVTKKISGGEKQ
jgi:small subunit ribosomal protein S17